MNLVFRDLMSHITAGTRPSDKQTGPSDKNVMKYVRDWDKLFLRDKVLFRQGLFGGHDTLQLILPACLRDEVFRALHNDLGHQGRDRTISLFK